MKPWLYLAAGRLESIPAVRVVQTIVEGSKDNRSPSRPADEESFQCIALYTCDCVYARLSAPVSALVTYGGGDGWDRARVTYKGAFKVRHRNLKFPLKRQHPGGEFHEGRWGGLKLASRT